MPSPIKKGNALHQLGDRNWIIRRLPEIPSQFRAEWRRLTGEILLKALQLHHRLMFEPITPATSGMVEREQVQLKIASEWLDRYFPKPKLMPDDKDGGTADTVAPAVWLQIVQISQQVAPTATPTIPRQRTISTDDTTPTALVSPPPDEEETMTGVGGETGIQAEGGGVIANPVISAGAQKSGMVTVSCQAEKEQQ